MSLTRTHAVAVAAVTVAFVAATVGFALSFGLVAWGVPEVPEESVNGTSPDADASEDPGDASPGDASEDPVDGERPPLGPFDVQLTVRADAGPFGEEPLPLRDRPVGTNVWFNSGWYPSVDPEWQTLLAGLEPGFLRWPAGHPSQNYCFQPEPHVPTPGCDARYVVTGPQLEQFVDLSRSVGAEPVIGVNVKKGSPDMAADMVRYANVENDLDITWWYVGNEPDLNRNDPNLPVYTAKYADYSDAMRAVDPDVKLVGPEIMTGANVMGTHGRPDWVRPFLAGNPGTVDAISWHLYPLDSENRNPSSPAHPSPEHLLQWYAEFWTPSGLSFPHDAQEKLRADRDELMPDAEIWITELGPDSGMVGAPGVTDAHVAAVWFADVVPRLLAGDADVVMQFAFDHWVEGQDELSLIQESPDGDGWRTLPPYDALHLIATTLGDEMVNASSEDEAHVSVHATRHEDGRVTAVLVNKVNEPVDARLTIEDAGQFKRADAWVLTGEEGPTSLTGTRVNGERLTSLAIEEGGVAPVDADPAADAVRALPPLSVTVITFHPDGES